MKIALFRRLSDGILASFEVIMEAELNLPNYVRVSEIVDVEFPKREDCDLLMEEVEKIDELIDQIKEDAARRMDALQKRRLDLLALTLNVEEG